MFYTWLLLLLVVVAEEILRILRSGVKRISDQLFWILTGVVAFTGTIFVGRLVSILYRPMFQEKYIYPVAAVTWLIFGFCISRLKYARWWGVAGMLALLVMLTPNYKMYWQFIQTQNAESAVFRNFTMTSEDVVLNGTTYVHSLTWKYYYPEAKEIKCSDPVSYLLNAEHTGNYWIFVDKELSEDSLELLRDYGCNVIETGYGMISSRYAYGYYITF